MSDTDAIRARLAAFENSRLELRKASDRMSNNDWFVAHDAVLDFEIYASADLRALLEQHDADQARIGDNQQRIAELDAALTGINSALTPLRRFGHENPLTANEIGVSAALRRIKLIYISLETLDRARAALKGTMDDDTHTD